MLIKNNKNIRILKNDKTAYENHVNLTFDLSNDVDNFDLEIFSNYFTSFVQYAIIEETLNYENKMAQTIDISSLKVMDANFSNRRTKKIRITFSYLDFNIDKNENRIKDLISQVFDIQAGKKLVDDVFYAIENQRIKERNISESDLLQLEAKWETVDTKNNKADIISKQMHELLVDENVKVEDIFEKFVNSYRKIFTNISETVVTITGQEKSISDFIISKVNEINFVEAKDVTIFNFDKDIKQIQNFKITSDTDKTIRFIGIANTSKKQEFLDTKLLKERLSTFYLNKIRGEYNLIYSPVIRTYISPNTLFCLEHQVQPTNLKKMLEKENEFFTNQFNEQISDDELKKIKLQFQKEVYYWTESGSEDALLSIVELFDDSKLEGEYTLEQLSQMALKIIDEIGKDSFNEKNFLQLTNYVVEAK